MSNFDYFKRFWTHKYNAILAGGCMTVLLLSGHVLGIIIALTAYVVGAINIPNMKFFRDTIDKDEKEKGEAIQLQKVEEFKAKRDAQLRSLVKTKRDMYTNASMICKDIEDSIGDGDGQSVFLSKVDELMWTYLKLLLIQQSLERFIEIEGREDIDSGIKAIVKEINVITKEIDGLKANNANNENDDLIAHKEKLLLSVQEKLNTVRKRVSRLVEARNNVEMVSCEEERLVEQIKLLRADATATKNSEGLSLKIDAAVEHLGQTNQWLSEMKDFKDYGDELPSVRTRIGYECPDNQYEAKISSRRKTSRVSANYIESL